ncbi:hypothetical protein SAMN06269185_1508 [Natronoarchaeum philippinense]|uniref:DeoxyPurine in DNA protein A domain-containing protein n=1 Tax=Natronoarchaeum philippinense TaxID=558529 RepID=A0A285NRM1_NATPI|nr:hypothetical protein [Natronoarchaeum philippinense]SNZ12125.1 hypothetical protein SAMN06269185_1508 [Natronoarchaeum philippinense]
MMRESADRFTFYFGAASGSSRKALRELHEPNVMLNYATQNNTPWDGIDRLFIDSGGYSFMKGKGEYTTSNAAYLEFLEDHSPTLYALRDYPCEPEVLETHGRTVREHQRMTTDRHRELINSLSGFEISGQPISVLQGWTIDDYLNHVDEMRDAGTLTDYVGIGSVCRRNREAEIRRIILAVRKALPSSTRLHAFGVKGSVLQYPDVRDALTSADSQSYEMQAQWSVLNDLDAGSKTWRDSALEYLKQKRRIRTILAAKDDADTEQATLAPTTDGGTARYAETSLHRGER